MSRRLLTTPGRIILSKPGYDPATAPENMKLLDSNWNYSGQILESRSISFPGVNFRINFLRTYHFVPAVTLISYNEPDDVSPVGNGPPQSARTDWFGAGTVVDASGVSVNLTGGTFPTLPTGSLIKLNVYGVD
jgi:hypothetical protein